MQTLIKYIKEAKYDSYMFEVMQVENEEDCILKIKTFNNKKYVYLSKKKIKCQDTLEKDNLYSVYVKQWVHIPYVRTLYYLSFEKKYEDTCNIDISSDSEYI